jgi:DNA-binding NarL/FixJ family response regulator
LLLLAVGFAMPVKIVLADDHPIVVEGLQHLAKGSAVEIVSHVVSPGEIAKAIRSHAPDVLVMEVRLNGQDALQTLEDLMVEFPSLVVVAFTGSGDPTYVARAAALGCSDFVPKTAPCKKLFNSIKNAAEHKPAPSDSLISIARSKMRRPRQTVDHDVPLTNREMQVLRHVSMGLSNREIGKSLGISVETVKEHVQNILRKLDVNDRTQAAVWAVKRGLV